MSDVDLSKVHEQVWRKCTTCKREIKYNAAYWVCNVSTCNRKRTDLVFCTVDCWDAHVPVLNHRESWAEDRKAPSREAWISELSGENKKPRTRKSVEADPNAGLTRVVDTSPKVILRRTPK